MNKGHRQQNKILQDKIYDLEENVIKELKFEIEVLKEELIMI